MLQLIQVYTQTHIGFFLYFAVMVKALGLRTEFKMHEVKDIWRG